MKRIICLIFSLLLVLIFAGCENSNKITPLLSDLSFTAKITCNGDTFEYDVKTTALKNNKIKLEAKNCSTGVIYTFQDSAITEEFSGIKVTRDISSLTKSSVLDILYLIFSDITENSKAITEKDDEYLIKSSCSKYDYTITFGSSGIPIEISENNFGAKVIIKNAIIKQQNPTE